MTHYRVTKVVNVHEWSNKYGQNYDFNLAVVDDNGQQSEIQVTAKSTNAYKEGKDFWAVPTGREYQGVAKLKRVENPNGNGSQPSGQPASSSPQAQTGFMLGGGSPKPVAMPYADALALIVKLAGEVNAEYGAPLLGAIFRGEVENPIKPKVIVRFMGADIETAGVNQEQWNRMMPLCERYAKLTDDKALRALLIATCQVATRKALTFDNAALFIEALNLSIAAEEAKQAPPPTDADFSPEDF